MGDTRRKGPHGKRDRDVFREELTSNPFQSALKDFKIAGPECICGCGKELDTREGRSLPNQRGSRNSLRHGWLNPACELASSERFFKVEFKKQGDRYLQYVLVNKVLAVPVHTDTELLAMIRAGETS